MNLQLDFEWMRTQGVFVATPMYGGKAEGLFMRSMMDLQANLMARGIPNKFSFMFNESLIPRARNYLVDNFIRDEKFQYFLFIDADIEFDPMDVLALMQLQKDVICGPYPKKTINWNNVDRYYKKCFEQGVEPDHSLLSKITGEYVFNVVPGTTNFNVLQPLQVLESGTGYMLVHRRVFDKFREEYPHLKYKPDQSGDEHFDGKRYIHAYFDTAIDPVTHRYLSEDYMFCQYVREMGMEVWLCPWMRTTHIGPYPYQGDMVTISQTIG